jgi:signal transduction histidine kinase
MPHDLDLYKTEPSLSATDQAAFERQTLALQALSKLSKQFACKPDFGELMDLVLLTVAGQFSAPSAFAVVYSSQATATKARYYGCGRFRNHSTLIQLVQNERCFRHFENVTGILHLPTEVAPENKENITALLSELSVRIVAPLWLQDRLFGLVGLGEKASRRGFDEHECALLEVLVNSITPIIINALLYSEIDGLRYWYADILNSVRQGVFVFDSDYRLRMVNRSGAQTLITALSEPLEAVSLLGKPLDQIFPRTTFPHWADRLLECVDNNCRKLVERLTAITPAGDKIFNVRVSRTSNVQGAPSDLIVSIDDITSQQETEIHLFELEKFAEMGVMVSSIAHELNNFLSMVVGGVEISRMSLSEGNMEETDTYLSKLMDTLDKMKRFTQGLIDNAKMDSKPRTAQLNAVVSDVLTFIQAQKRFTGIQVAIDFNSDLPMIELDTDQITQLLLNFLNNAADAIRLAGRSDGKITVKTDLKDSKILLSVGDNGVGIPPEVKEKLFLGRLTTKKEGHGYGLVTCAKILEHHRAKISIESEINQGSTFIVSFPIR